MTNFEGKPPLGPGPRLASQCWFGVSTEVTGDQEISRSAISIFGTARCRYDGSKYLNTWDPQGSIAPDLARSMEFESTAVVKTATATRKESRRPSPPPMTTATPRQTAGSEALQSYDVVAAVPCCQKSFEMLCKASDVDVISLPAGQRLPFTINKKNVSARSVLRVSGHGVTAAVAP